MSETAFTDPHRNAWWGDLGLRFPYGQYELEVKQAIISVLTAHPPIGFAGHTDDTTISSSQLGELVSQAAASAKLQAEQRRFEKPEEHRKLGWAKVEEALTGPEADHMIVEGPWKGLTRGEATAWCWNLFQYEPHGFVFPGSHVRVEATRELVDGGLPEVFGYPERARTLAASGVTPREYRRHKELQGARLFTRVDFTSGTVG